MHLTIKERVELVLMSGADGATNRSVAKKFNRIYPDREPISHTTIGRLILKFRETGSVLDKPNLFYMLWCVIYGPPCIMLVKTYM